VAGFDSTADRRYDLIDPTLHGMAFGVLAAVNGVGDFLSSTIVGLLWSAFGTTFAFGYSAVLFILGAAPYRCTRQFLAQDRDVLNIEFCSVLAGPRRIKR
jgi:dipeptide/tripeptide permease